MGSGHTVPGALDLFNRLVRRDERNLRHHAVVTQADRDLEPGRRRFARIPL